MDCDWTVMEYWIVIGQGRKYWIVIGQLPVISSGLPPSVSIPAARALTAKGDKN